MTFRTLIRRSLRFHWRSHLGVVIGAAIGSAALTGALVVGDSVKASLRERALQRLGSIEFVLDAGDRFFLDSLGVRMPRDLMDNWRESGRNTDATEPADTTVWFNGGPATVLAVRGAATRPGGVARANHVQVLGISQQPATERGAHYYDFWSYCGWHDAPAIEAGEVWLNESLSRQLGVGLDEEVVLRVNKAAALASDAPVSPRADRAVGLRLRVARIVGPEQLGDFAVRSTATPPLNAFVNLAGLQDALDITNRANLLVTGGVMEQPEGGPLGSGRGIGAWLKNMLPGATALARPAAQAQADLQRAVADHVTIGDYESAFHVRADGQILALTSRRIFLDLPIERAALAADTNAQPILTYIANLIISGTNATPYSMVTAAGAPWTSTDLVDDEIVLNQWLADDLQARPGDTVTLVYYDPESGARLTERTNTFRIHSIVPMEMPWADRTLMPDFPGIEKAESTADWDTAFPLTYQIRGKDDDYWREHRGTPKAFVTLAAGKQMWGNRFGEVTAIRFPVSTNAATALTPALSPGEGEDRQSAQRMARASRDRSDSPQRMQSTQISPLPAGEGQGEGEGFEAYRAALEQKILDNLDPAELGLRFEPVREQALKAAAESQDFGGLFIGFSLFLIAAALILMALLFQFGLEQRSAEAGTLLALGFTPKQVRRLLLGEGAALAFIGGVLGVLGGVAYANGMLLGLRTVWRDAVGAASLGFFVTPVSLGIGLLASTVVAIFTLWLALRKQARQPAMTLLNARLGDGTGEREDCGRARQSAGGRARQPVRILTNAATIGGASLALAAGLVGWALATGETTNAGVFFGAGALVLIGGLALMTWRLRHATNVLPTSRRQIHLNIASKANTSSGLPTGCQKAVTLKSLALRGLARRRSRSAATAALLACGTFLILSIGVFRLDATRDATQPTSGTGGYALIGEATLPVAQDLNTGSGRDAFALDPQDLEGVTFVQFRVRAGDEASCLNLNRAQEPRLLGVNPEAMAGRFTFAKAAKGMNAGDGWQLLKSEIRNPKSEIAVVPAIGDLNSILWAMGRKVGDTIDYVDDRGRPFRVRIVGAVANSILQGNLIIDEGAFVERFPDASGYQYFLMEAPSNRVTGVSAELSRALQDHGLEVTPAVRRLDQFNAVQNTYLGTFQILGGLGLLLGSAGLGIVVLRNVLERRGELAVLVAVGFRKQRIGQLVLMEHGALLGMGLAIGLVAAAVAVLPTVLSPGAQLPYATLVPTVLAVSLNGLAWTWLSTRAALRGNVLEALRNE